MLEWVVVQVVGQVAVAVVVAVVGQAQVVEVPQGQRLVAQLVARLRSQTRQHWITE
jgi:hypothetical protein